MASSPPSSSASAAASGLLASVTADQALTSRRNRSATTTAIHRVTLSSRSRRQLRHRLQRVRPWCRHSSIYLRILQRPISTIKHLLHHLQPHRTHQSPPHLTHQPQRHLSWRAHHQPTTTWLSQTRRRLHLSTSNQLIRPEKNTDWNSIKLSLHS